MIRTFEAFAGYGSQSLALKRLGVDYEVVGISEIDKYAIKVYEALHGETLNLGDISKVNVKDVPDHDLFTYSFPCQDISVAGKQEGIKDGTRSGLLWECERIIKHKKPKCLLMENVKNLVGKKHKADFDKWCEWLESQGYTNYWKVLNAKNYGVPQNRERVFMISILGEHKPYEFPLEFDNGIRLRDILEYEVDEKYYIDNEKTQKLLLQLSDKYDMNACNDKVMPCLTPERVKKRQEGRRFKDNDEPAFTITSQDRHGVLMVEIPQKVSVRKYDVDIDSLKECLKTHKNMSNKEIAEKLNKPLTLVEHWFRRDNSFSIPNQDVWFKLKELLCISETKFDESIITFEDKLNVYEKSNRCYIEHGVSPTLMCSDVPKVIQVGNYREKSEGFTNPQTGRVYSVNGCSPTLNTMQGGDRQPKIIIDDTQGFDGVRLYSDYSPTIRSQRSGLKTEVDYRIRKLTPKECFRLMGLRDDDINIIQEAEISNSQQYKLAGNSIVVDVLAYIFKNLIESVDFN